MRMLKRARRAAAPVLLLAGLVFGQLPVDAQNRRPQEPAKSVGGADSLPGAVAAALPSAARGREMAAAYETGRLPAPLRRPPGEADEAAASLAKMISARDGQSTAALLAALLAAGFGVRDPDGGVTQTVQPGQGLAFEAWEVAAMAKMYGENRMVPLTYLADGLKSIPQLKQAPLDTILLEGIRRHARGSQPSLRFWARLIVELGRHADRPYDILGGAAPQDVRLDAAQAALILRRLAGDFYALGQQKQASVTPGGGDARRARFVRASGGGSPPRLLEARHAGPAPQGGGPCGNMAEGATGLILDAAALGITTGWGAVLEHVGAEKAAFLLNVVNILLAYAKLIATYAALETELTVENPPLVRTTNSQAGGRRRLTAKVKLNVGKWEQINCLRTALNVATGLDTGMLKDGPVEGAEVNWHMVYGEDGDIASITDGGPRIQDAGTYAGAAGRPGTRVGTPTRSKTDAQGEARIFLEGEPKVPYVTPPLVPVMKEVGVRTTIRMKAGDLKGDAVDVAGQALGGVLGLVTMPAELLYRTDWASSGWLNVPVRDHETCRGGWSGQITQTESFENAEGTNAASHTRENKKKFQYQATVKLVDGPRPAGAGENHVEAEISASGSVSSYVKVENRTTPGASFNKRWGSEAWEEYGGSTREGGANVTINIRPDGTYSVTFDAICVKAEGTRTLHRYTLGSGFPEFQKRDETETKPLSQHVCPTMPGVHLKDDYIGITGRLDPQNPQTLSGSRTFEKPLDENRSVNRKITITWSLTRCQ